MGTFFLTSKLLIASSMLAGYLLKVVMVNKKGIKMATSIKLSKITKVDLRDCWQNEASSIDLVKKFNLNDPAEHDKIFSWYREYAEKFITFFKPIIKKI